MKKKIYTCYGCTFYYAEDGERYPTKHCGKDHLKCPYYWGDSEV